MNGCRNFEELWSQVAGLPLTQNDYRVFLELCVYGEMNQRMLCEKRGWKPASISRSVRRLQEIGVILCTVKKNVIYYRINDDFKITNDFKEEELDD